MLHLTNVNTFFSIAVFSASLPGDLHDSTFDYMEVSADFTNNLNIADGTKSGLFLTQGKCSVKVRIYPSQKYEDTYTSSTPAIVTSAVALVFVFTVLMFLVYDRLVERRQRIVLSKAMTTSALVSSLFPSNVANKLLADKEKAASGAKKNRENKKEDLHAFLTDGDEEQDEEENLTDQSVFKSAPICDLYPESTILFADLAGMSMKLETVTPLSGDCCCSWSSPASSPFYQFF